MTTEISTTNLTRSLYHRIAEPFVGGQSTPVAATRRELVVRKRSYAGDFWAELRPDGWVNIMTAIVMAIGSLVQLTGVAVAAPVAELAASGFSFLFMLGMIWTDTLAGAKWRTEVKRLE